MIKKLLTSLIIFTVIFIIILATPLPSYLLKSLIISKIESGYQGNLNFNNFSYVFPYVISADSLTYSRGKINLKTSHLKLKITSMSLLNSRFVVSCYIEDIKYESEEKNVFAVFSMLSRSSGFTDFNRLKYDYVKANIHINKKELNIKDIEAVGPQSKIYGALLTDEESTDYDIDLYLPAEATKDMPDWGKSLLSVDEQGKWSKIKINISTLK